MNAGTTSHTAPSADWWRRVAPPPALAPGGIQSEAPKDARVAFWAVVAFTVILVLVPQQYLPILGALRINMLVGVFAIAAFMFRKAPPGSASMPLELRIVLGIICCGALSVPVSYWPTASLFVFIDFLKVLAVFWLLGQVVSSVPRLRIMFWTLALLCVPLAKTTVSNYLAGEFEGSRVQGYSNNMAANPNDLALLLNLFLPLAVAVALTTAKRWAKLLVWGIVALSLAAVFVTFSRGGFLTLVVEGGLIVLLLWRHQIRRAVVGVAIGAVLAVVLAPAGYIQRIGTIFNIESDSTGSAQMRWQDTLTAVEFVVTHPIIGAGIGQDVLAMNEVRGFAWTRVHNAYLSYGMDLGIVGLVLFLTLVAVTYRSARKVERLPVDRVGRELVIMAGCVRVSLAGFIVAAFFHPVAYHFFFYYIAGLAVALKTTARRQFGLTI